MFSSKTNELAKECGDINSPEVCRYVLGYSPYHIAVNNDLKTDALILITNDDMQSMQHSYKFAAKLRRLPLRNKVIVKDLRKASDNERCAYSLAFLLKSLYKTEKE